MGKLEVIVQKIGLCLFWAVFFYGLYATATQAGWFKLISKILPVW